jgi:hypothetical protein
MVNSQKESMDMNVESVLNERVTAVERKVDALSAAVATGFAEQRAYTDSLYTLFDGRFGQIDRRFGQIEGRFAQSDGRFTQIDAGLAHIDERFGQMDVRFDRLEHKLDGFIETQSRFNQLAERRLARLERDNR